VTGAEHRARIAAAFAKARAAQRLADDAQNAAEYAWQRYAEAQEQAAEEEELAFEVATRKRGQSKATPTAD
jgi:3-methyladenine DNA glycosylase Tag